MGTPQRVRRRHTHETRLRPQLDTVALGEVQVVEREHVLCLEAAVGPLRPLAGEVGIARRHALCARRSLQHRDRRGTRAVGTLVDGGAVQCPVRTVRVGRGGAAHHALRQRVERPQGLPPVGAQQDPLRPGEDGFVRHGQRVSVDERAAADAVAVYRDHAACDGRADKSPQAERGLPEVLEQVPVAGGEAARLPAPALLEHADAVALLAQAQGSHRPAKAGADHDPIEVKGAANHMQQSCAWMDGVSLSQAVGTHLIFQ